MDIEARLETADLASQVPELSREVDIKMKLLESKLKQCHSQIPGHPQDTVFPFVQHDSESQRVAVDRITNDSVKLRDLYKMLELVDRVNSEIQNFSEYQSWNGYRNLQ